LPQSLQKLDLPVKCVAQAIAVFQIFVIFAPFVVKTHRASDGRLESRCGFVGYVDYSRPTWSCQQIAIKSNQAY
jgi:hypothetical protein